MWNSSYKSIQGNIGLGRAIAYFTSINIPVCIPLNDTQKYDLVVDLDGLKKVSVKTTSYFRNYDFVVQLKNTGGASGIHKIRTFDNTTCDYVFILTKDDIMYLIPSNDIKVKNTLTLTNKWDRYKVDFI